MTIALWETPPAALLAAALEDVAPPGVQVVRDRPEACVARLLRGAADAALLPTTMALQAADGLVFAPGIALSSWAYPYARLVLEGGLHTAPETVAYDRRAVQERTLARIVLSEHYQWGPTFVEREGGDMASLRDGDADALLCTGPAAPSLDVAGTGGASQAFALDLGREWYEVASYPMVWGLMAAKKDRMAPEAVRLFVAAAERAEALRGEWLAARSLGAAEESFFRDALRVRFDDLAIASLTELKQYLFYYDVLDEIPSLRLADLPEEDEQAARGRQPLA